MYRASIHRLLSHGLVGVLLVLGAAPAWGQSTQPALPALPALPTNWQQLPLEQYADLAVQWRTGVPAVTEQVKHIRQQIAETAWERFLQGGRGLDQNRAATLHLAVAITSQAAALTADQKQQLVEQLKRKVVQPAVLAQMPPSEMTALYALFHHVRVPGAPVTATAVAWMNASEQWKQCNPRELQALLAMLRQEPYPDLDATTAQMKVTDHLWSKWFSEHQYLQSPDRDQILRLIPYVPRQLTSLQRQQLATGLAKKIEGDPQWANSLSGAQVQAIVMALSSLGAQDTAAHFFAQWYAVAENRQQASAAMTEQIIAELSAGSGNAAGAGLLNSLKLVDEALLQKHARFELSVADYWRNVCRYHTAGSIEQAAQWTHRFAEFLLERPGAPQPSLGDLQLLGRAMFLSGLSGEGHADQRFAAALAQALAAGEQLEGLGYEEYHALAAPLGTDGTRERLKQQWVDQNGRLRPAVAKVLAYAYKRAGKLDVWKGVLDGKLKDPSLGGDARVAWLAARAYAEDITPAASSPYQYSPLLGKRWLDEAMGAAQSQTVRVGVLEELIQRYAQSGEFEAGLSLLKSVADQYADAASAAVLRQLETTLTSAQRAAAAQQPQLAQSAQQRVMRGELEMLKRRLQEAKAAGKPQDEIATLEAMIQQRSQAIAAQR